MKSGLNKRTVTDGDIYEKAMVNVFDINTKTIVFTGGIGEVANFLGVPQPYARKYLREKTRFKKKYALRFAKSQS